MNDESNIVFVLLSPIKNRRFDAWAINRRAYELSIKEWAQNNFPF